MNILFVHENRGFQGGVEQYVRDVAGALAARGHTCTLLYGKETGRGQADFDGAFTRFIQDPSLATGGPRESPALERLVRDASHDVAFLHKVPRLAPFLVPGHIPLARMVHDHDVTCPRKHRYDAYTHTVCDRPAGWHCALDLGFVERDASARLGVRFKDPFDFFRDLAAHRMLDALVVASRYMQQSFAVNGVDARRVHVVPPPIRPSAARPVPVPVAPRLLYVGQLIRGKGIDQLVRAVAALPPETRLDVVGDGNARAQLAADVARRGLSERVRFRGWVSHDELGALYDAARVVVVPSRWPEPFGMVGLEAMTRGRAVVGFDVGGIPDWLEDHVSGRLVPAGDVDALARALTEVLAPGRAEQLGAGARQLYQKRFQFSTIVESIEELLTRVAKPRVELRTA